MKKTMMKRIFNIVGISALAVLCLACHDGLQIQEQYGKATVSFSVIEARTVLPQFSLEDASSYKLLGGIGGEPETEMAEFTTRGTVISLAPGMWNFTLNAYNYTGHILQGKVANKQINLTETNQVVFSLSPVDSGTGEILITINSPASADITRVVAKSDTSSENLIVYGNGTFIYLSREIAGDHLFNFELYRGAVLRAVVSELILVRSGLTSRKTITLEGDDLKPVLTGTVSIIGTAAVGQTLAADTNSLDGVGSVSYQWRRTNGETTVEIGTDSDTYTVQDTDAGGVITVTVTRDNYLGGMTSAPITIKDLTRTVVIDMYDVYEDGWNGDAALRINVNGVDIATGVKVPTTGANTRTNTYTFNVKAGDVVQLYWVAGIYQEENAFIVYYADTPPRPAFNYSSWNGTNALAYKLINTMIGSTLLGSFTVIGQ
jgi:hypothetical protein